MTETRQHAIAAVRAQLERQASPRLHMSALVTATSTAGLIASWAMLHLGLTSMKVRYPLAVVIAYLVFLGLVGLWLRRFRLRRRREAVQHVSSGVDLDVDLIEVPIGDMLRPSGSTPTFDGFGRGGGFSGGGSSATWGDGVPAAPLPIASASPVSLPDVSGGGGGGGGGGGKGISIDADDDTIWLIVVLVIVVVVLLSVAVYVVYTAPVLLSELLLDAGLAAGLYGRLSRGEPHSWLWTAVRGTIVPAAVAAILLALAGIAMEHLAPGATSIGRVVQHVTGSRTASSTGSTP